MFNSSKIYNLLKPVSNPNLITKLPVIVGGTTAVPDLINGAVIITMIGNKPISSQHKDMYFDTGEELEKGSSYIQLTYQIDIYKKNSKNATSIEAEDEAIKIQEWLKSFEVVEYLETLQSEILPNYKEIKLMHNIEVNKNFTNRAFFDFQIITKSEIFESIHIIDKVIFENDIIFQGENENE